MTLLLLLWGKTKFYFAMAGAVVVAIGLAFLSGRRKGAASVRERIDQRTKKVQEKWDAIDRRDDTLDTALDRLRDDR